MERFLVKRFYGNKHYLSVLSLREWWSPHVWCKDHTNLNLYCLRETCQIHITTCDGLVYLDDYNGMHYICNPSTQEMKCIPQSKLPRPPGLVKISFNGSGFGYDSKSNDYKVIRNLMHVFEDDEDMQMELYSLKDNCWKPIPYPSDIHICPTGSTYVQGSGTYYWPANFENGLGVLSFDFADESFSPHCLPPFMANCNYLIDLVDLGGQLGFTASQKTGESKSFQLWRFDQKKWQRVFSIVLKDVRRIVGLKADDGLLFLEGKSDSEGLCPLLVYDWIAKVMVKTLEMSDYRGEMKILSYVESKVPLPGALPINGPHNDEAHRRSRIGTGEVDFTQMRRLYMDYAASDTDEDWEIDADKDASDADAAAVGDATDK